MVAAISTLKSLPLRWFREHKLGHVGTILFDGLPCDTHYNRLGPYYLLHGREMTLPSSEDLNANLSKEKKILIRIAD